MRIETYRGVPFIDREEEIEFFVDWFSEAPQRILFVYGPKSSGKTTVIEYVVEKKLLIEKEWWIKGKYWVKYLNLRGKLITSYRSFLEALIVPEEVYEETVETNVNLTLGLISLESRKIEQIKEKKRNLFDVLMEEIEKERRKKKKPILIIDEVQKLRDVYIANGNGERELLKEFLNFCVRLTKETHLCHVVILTSNTVFVERIYNDAKMKLTSDFKKIGHLERWRVAEWLGIEGLRDKEIELVWEYLGGCIPLILKMFSYYQRGRELKEYLEEQRWLAYTEIDEYLAEFSEEETEFLLRVAKEIVEKGYFSISGLKIDKRKLLQKWAEKEILFYDPLELKVTGNNRIYEKGMELLLERYT
jgi:AAA+ ATPase superfamily predicted ATPase